ncbi:hypothetical protein VFPBJ_10007 [Purpureocillium lilacinum]|uniref:Uncharacterized protein n=1 Tax=Purpureocillium lilacinum TaxID=33203 RepID=A0A179GA67_PURLI|nr:hypothetical protein VFPBJ_10007 [Purpureocillium lilacinum]
MWLPRRGVPPAVKKGRWTPSPPGDDHGPGWVGNRRYDVARPPRDRGPGDREEWAVWRALPGPSAPGGSHGMSGPGRCRGPSARDGTADGTAEEMWGPCRAARRAGGYRGRARARRVAGRARPEPARRASHSQSAGKSHVVRRIRSQCAQCAN